MRYSRSTLNNWTKAQLINHIECLEHNLEVARQQSIHFEKTLTTAMSNSKVVRDEVYKVLDIWNKSGGIKYE